MKALEVISKILKVALIIGAIYFVSTLIDADKRKSEERAATIEYVQEEMKSLENMSLDAATADSEVEADLIRYSMDEKIKELNEIIDELNN